MSLGAVICFVVLLACASVDELWQRVEPLRMRPDHLSWPHRIVATTFVFSGLIARYVGFVAAWTLFVALLASLFGPAS